mmetsp:Transcript_7731/g.13235  ORF Transcript_7731/g.13235 Transcript_7731/m.13235 type:complete len:198 (-) Transcript_7731:1235-1828(-)
MARPTHLRSISYTSLPIVPLYSLHTALHFSAGAIAAVAVLYTHSAMPAPGHRDPKARPRASPSAANRIQQHRAAPAQPIAHPCHAALHCPCRKPAFLRLASAPRRRLGLELFSLGLFLAENMDLPSALTRTISRIFPISPLVVQASSYAHAEHRVPTFVSAPPFQSTTRAGALPSSPCHYSPSSLQSPYGHFSFSGF